MTPRSSRNRRTDLHLERLEDRYVMDGDPVPLLAFPVPEQMVIDIAPRIVLPGDWWPYQLPEQEEVTAEDPLFASVDQIPAWLIDEVDRRYEEQFGSLQTGLTHWWPGFTYRHGDVLQMAAADAGYSSPTNTQVEGVDEADLVETDGEHIYYISENELIIVDARDTENLSIVSRVQLAERPTGMYLAGDRLTLISADEPSSFYAPRVGLMVDAMWYGGQRPYAAQTIVTVLDVSDRSAPTQVQKTEVSGRYVSSRMVAGELRLVVQQQSMSLIDYLPAINFEMGFDATTQSYVYSYESRDSYLNRVQQTLSKSIVPTCRVLDTAGEVVEEQSLIPLEELLTIGGSRHGTTTTVAVFDTLGDMSGAVATKSINTAEAAVVYATEDHLYVLGRDFQDSHRWQPNTSIWKLGFDAEDRSIRLLATGEVAGQPFNQFAVDEHGGYLRVVTSVGSSDQSLFVLEQMGSELAIVGAVESLAPGESLRSVRFMGSRAYLVTFRLVDPLFAIDLSNPTSPTIRGELKIPGFTEYLQPIDANHLIGIGRGSSEQFQTLEELQVSVFDVTNLDDPQLSHRYSFGGDLTTATIVTGGRWTQGDGDHHALSYFDEEQLLALPIYTAEHNNWHGIANTPLFEAGEGGLQLFHIDVTIGITPIALIEHDTPIVRSLRLGDRLVALSAGKITVHSFTDPTIVIEELDLEVGSGAQLVNLSDHRALTLAAAHDANLFSNGFWMPALTTHPVESQSQFQQASGPLREFDYSFVMHLSTNAGATTPSVAPLDRAFESFFVPVSRSLQHRAKSLSIDLNEAITALVVE